eukprot:Sdes_comp24140_c0_seq1m22174
MEISDERPIRSVFNSSEGSSATFEDYLESVLKLQHDSKSFFKNSSPLILTEQTNHTSLPKNPNTNSKIISEESASKDSSATCSQPLEKQTENICLPEFSFVYNPKDLEFRAQEELQELQEFELLEKNVEHRIKVSPDSTIPCLIDDLEQESEEEQDVKEEDLKTTNQYSSNGSLDDVKNRSSSAKEYFDSSQHLSLLPPTSSLAARLFPG